LLEISSLGTKYGGGKTKRQNCNNQWEMKKRNDDHKNVTINEQRAKQEHNPSEEEDDWCIDWSKPKEIETPTGSMIMSNGRLIISRTEYWRGQRQKYSSTAERWGHSQRQCKKKSHRSNRCKERRCGRTAAEQLMVLCCDGDDVAEWGEKDWFRKMIWSRRRRPKTRFLFEKALIMTTRTMMMTIEKYTREQRWNERTASVDTFIRWRNSIKPYWR